MNSIRAERALSFSFLWGFQRPPGHSFKLSPNQMMVPKGLTAPFLAPLPSCARSVLVTQCAVAFRWFPQDMWWVFKLLRHGEE